VERCTVCILPRNYEAVTFDEEGICNLCRDRISSPLDEAAAAEQRTALEEIISAVRAEGRRYDCIVPLSGGQDSAYVAYLMQRRFGLRVLAVNFDNGYRSPLALENIERTTGALRMDLITLHPDRNLLYDLYAHFFRRCGYFCAACNAFGYIVIGSFAVREGRLRGKLPLVVGGWSRKYEYQPGLSVLSMRSFGRILCEDEELTGRLRRSPLVEPQVFEAFLAMEDARQLLSKRPADGRAESSLLRVIHLPEYVDWDYRTIGETLESELGWRRSSVRKDAHFDCRLAPLQEYLKHRRFGFGQMTIKNSVLVREGRMTREEALRRAGLEQSVEPEILSEVLERWGLTSNEVAWDGKWAE